MTTDGSSGGKDPISSDLGAQVAGMLPNVFAAGGGPAGMFDAISTAAMNITGSRVALGGRGGGGPWGS